MGEKIINSIIASIVGCISAIGMVWYLTEKPAAFTVTVNEKATPSQERDRHEITADIIHINDTLKVVDNKGDVLLEYKNGAFFMKKEVVTDNIFSNVITSNKVKITNGDLLNKESPVFGEIAALDSGGAYMALLSPRGTHSMNIGFDKKETGFILSQNNEDNSIVAQAIMPKPNTKVVEKPNMSPAKPAQSIGATVTVSPQNSGTPSVGMAASSSISNENNISGGTAVATKTNEVPLTSVNMPGQSPTPNMNSPLPSQLPSQTPVQLSASPNSFPQNYR